ncbi:MAG TPA: IPT/TIG domain-containing protein [Pyrinomonadaceae bacterium]|nr:IPT/TIG domain-containing protein [Pyrinomonadaceae bacterium]
MAVSENKAAQSERNKKIAAIALGAVAIIALAYMFLGSSSKSGSTTGTKRTPTPAVRNQPVQSPQALRETEDFVPTPINYEITPSVVPEAARNIFAFYVPPKPAPKPTALPPPPPTPVPPNVIVASISPVNVYAHTGDFNLDVTGDKFTPETRIFIGGAELQTRFVSPQQVSTKVPAQLISFEGGREVQVRSRDGQLFSNTATLNVMPAPVPNYNYIGVLTRNGANDTAIMKEKNGKELLNVQRGDMLGGRFRVTSISVREVTLTDTSLNIKHRIQFSGDTSGAGAPGQTRYPQPPQPPPPADDDDNEP